MEYKKIIMWVKVPDGYSESELDLSIADTVCAMGGEVIEVLPHQNDDTYSDKDYEG